jgi:glycosyltransferase involved in cell wall biosynthesis
MRPVQLVVISFIIPAHNESELIGGTVRALREAAERLEHEIIVVDDGSTDRTADTALREGAAVVGVGARHIAAARNAGARASRGEMLVFVDADTIVPRGAVREAVLAIERGAVGGGAGVRFDGWVPVYARVMLAVLVWVFRALRLTGGCFLFCRRDTFEAAGGWDERFYVGEEVRLCRALKRFGKFVVIRERVVTSGRKLRTYSAREVLGTMLRLGVRGLNAGRTREETEMWYGERREDRRTK